MRQRVLVSWVRESFAITRSRACGLMMLQRSSFYYRVHRRDNRALTVRLKELAAVRVRYGYRRLTILLRREGWAVNAKRVYRIYREENLSVRTKVRRKRAAQPRVPLGIATAPNQRWSMDFMTDRLINGGYFRVLTIVDQFRRECPLLEAGSVADGQTGGRLPGAAGAFSRAARIDHRGQRRGVLQQGSGRLGIPARSESKE